MATNTARNLVEKALQKIGVVAEGETPTAAQMEDGLDSLNMMLASWAADGILTLAVIEDSFTLVAGTPTYSIGANQTFNASKPFSVSGAYVRDTNGYDTQLGIVTRDTYNSYGDKDARGFPASLFYDPGASQQANQAGTIKIYPAPDAAYTLYLASEKPITEFTNLTDTITFLPAYKRPIVNNLAVELAPDYGRPVSAELAMVARESKAIIENVNSRNRGVVSMMSFPGMNAGYNIFTDEQR